MVNHGQSWLIEVPFHKPMVDHGLGKLCQSWLTMVCDIYVDSSKLSMVNHGYKHCQPWLTMSLSTMVNHAYCN